jgi:nucleotide-binding universal stress UspA family protein
MNPEATTRVLIPLDGSSAGESILLGIFPLIRAQRVETTLLRVVETRNETTDSESYLEQRRRILEKDGLKTRPVIAIGRPVEEILRQAKSGDFDLIAMTTHGRTGHQRVMMGSVAEEVVRSSPIPVLLCKGGTPMGNWERIVVALDGTPGSEEILADVVRLARSVGAQVHLLRVGLPLLTAGGYRGSRYEFPAQDTTSYLASVADRLVKQGVTAVVEKREGIAGVEIPLLARELDAGLICMTTEGRPEQSPGLDRSVAAEVIRSAPCVVYVRRMIGAPGTKETGRKKPAEAR